MPLVRVRILGPVGASLDGQPVPIGGHRQVKLFAVLVLNANRAVSSDALIDAVWGASRSGPDKRLQVAIARLRKALEPLTRGSGLRLRTVSGGYLLSLASGELDAEVFQDLVQAGWRALEAGEPASAAEALTQALGLWRGPPLAEVAFEDFAQPEIRRLEELRLEALEARIDAGLRLGRHEQMIGELERLLAEHPSRERFAAELMLALYRCCRQAEALAVYQRTRAHLAHELGLEPGPALQAMQEQVLRQDPEIDLRHEVVADTRSVIAGEHRTRRERLIGPPLVPTSTIGRQREIKAVCELLESREAQLVTLTGPGGVGKTRVALTAAHAMQASIPQGVGWVELAGVARPQDVAPAIARTLGLRTPAGESVSAALCRHLDGRRLLLVIDNFEHVLAGAVLVAELLAACPGLSVLATSREALDLWAEHRILIEPLAVPQAKEDVTVVELESTDASALFIAAARRRDARFQATPQNAFAIARICARLQGLPLALELAAARAGALGVDALSARAEEAVSDLGTGPGDAPARHHTMRATIDWSFRLLDLDQFRAVVRFGVFAGGATLDATHAVTGATPDTLEALVAKSLMNRRDQPDGSSRFSMLETIREYALERLRLAPEHEAIGRAHASWFLQLARQAEEHLHSGSQIVWLSRLDAETDNLREVLAWSLEHDVVLGVELAKSLEQAWRVRGHTHELIAWLQRALASPAATDVETRAVCLTTYGGGLLNANAPERAQAPLECSLPLLRSIGDRPGEAGALLDLGTVAWYQAAYEEAMALSEAALAIYRDAGDERNVGRSMHRIGDILRDSGDLEGGKAALEQALAIVTELADWHRFALVAGSLGDLALDQGNQDQAADQYLVALSAAIDIGDETSQYVCLAGLACVAALHGDLNDAGRLWAAAQTTEFHLGTRLHPHERERYERIVARLIHDQRFQEGQAAGRDLPLRRLVHQLVDHPSRLPLPREWPGLAYAVASPERCCRWASDSFSFKG